MTVLLYQLAIIASITISYRWRQKAGLALAIAWTLWSLVMLVVPPFMLMQLCFVWGTYFVNRHVGSKSSRVSLLESQLRDLPQALREQVRSLDEDKLEFVSGEQHRGWLEEAIRSSKERVCILSGWITSYVVDERMISNLRKALERGVDVFLGYGWEDSRGQHEQPDAKNRAVEELQRLREESEQLGFDGSLAIGRFANHEKILVQDSEFVVLGSHNWLSNDGFRNSERSIVVRQSDIAKSEGDRVERLVRSHLVLH